MAGYGVEKWSNEKWEVFAQTAHALLFDQHRDTSLNRHHFVITIVFNGQLGGYFTCLEMDSETLYIQYGGAMPWFWDSFHIYPGFVKMLGWCRENYKRFWMRVENTNLAMLKMALKAGFIINGISNFKGKIYLELYQEVL